MFQFRHLSGRTRIAFAGLLVLQIATWQASRAQTCAVRQSLDNPEEGASVQPQQTISGWAVDLSASNGTGIDAVVVSLDGPLDSPDRRAVGVAIYGSPRADIAESLGDERFTNSGFTLSWDASTASPGLHQLVVEAHGSCGWQAQTRTIVVGGSDGVVATAPPPPGAPVPPPPGASAVAGVPPAAVAPASGTSPVGLATPTPTRPVPGSPAPAAIVTPGVIPAIPTTTALRPPQNLRLLAIAATGVTLAWDPPTGDPPAGYLIHQSNVGAGNAPLPPVTIARVPAATTSLTLPLGLDPTRYTYYFTVSSLGANGMASPYLSTDLSTTPPGTRVALPPTPVGGGVAAAAATTPGVAAAGAAATNPLTPGVAGAAVANPLTPGVAGAAAANPLTPGVAGRPGGLTPGAVTGATTSLTPGVGAAAVPGAAVPAAAVVSSQGAGVAAGGAFTATASPVSGTSGTLNWSPLDGAAAYNVYGASIMVLPQQSAGSAAGGNTLGGAAPGTWVAVQNNVRGTSATVSGLVTGGAYAFVVRAVNGAGQEFSQSGTAQLSLPAIADPSAAGGGLTLSASPGASGGASLSWNPVAGAVAYSLLVARAGGQFAPDPQRASITTTSVNIDALPPNAQFTFMIVARDGTGQEVARSNPAPLGGAPAVGAPPAGAGPPGVPPGGAPPPGAPPGGAPPAGVPPGSAPGPTGAGSFPPAQPPVQPTPFVPTGPSAGSAAPITGGPAPASATGTVLSVTGSQVDPAAISLQWNGVSRASAYAVYMQPPGGTLQPLSRTPTANLAAYVPIQGPGTYNFTVKALDANGTEISTSSQVTITAR